MTLNSEYPRVLHNGNLETSYSPSDFVNPESYTTQGILGKPLLPLIGDDWTIEVRLIKERNA